MRIGYTLMTEQAGPKDLVGHAASAERAGFDFEVCSDHYSPWLAEQGHAPYAWSVLGAVAQVTERVDLMTFVTCPIMRYHPAVVAQKAATVQLLSDDRFTLGLGAGENLNEHVIGQGWPPVNVRHDMLAEALQIIGGLFDGGTFSYEGKHFRVDSAKLWDLSPRRVPIGVAVSGKQSVHRFAPQADVMIAVEPDPGLCGEWDATRLGPPTRKIAQLPVAWDADRAAAIRRAHGQFRWFGGGWKVNSELPGPAGFAGATQFVREEDVAGSIPCGPDVEPIRDAVRQFADSGFTDLALVQIGGEHQSGFFEFAEKELLPALRAG
ncbi:TIGR03557 family F420-dependent LLM class oxidoreductase [Amycolatopsis sp. FDAARGOS 1241]|uniref:TIGR03557 family F420-dependent LLM class oxidoreductase n=1 Tax=Amycolatopsis sp. FDAARGOS 1241 TaxID=2778070 RepID=UPI00195003CE|nr:TIGR03557 family F420-dependent LLM class oxidoreductase [Amycolatopsis sp. FDAARGOS 1241]QRP49540.1 TIGR03557 family F420-dependent LLM class oxidoreductase [Amycolatopsis sp. FDAARGOS 1241]